MLRALSHWETGRHGPEHSPHELIFAFLVLGLFFVRRLGELHRQAECGGVAGLGEGGLYDVC